MSLIVRLIVAVILCFCGCLLSERVEDTTKYYVGYFTGVIVLFILNLMS